MWSTVGRRSLLGAAAFALLTGCTPRAADLARSASSASPVVPAATPLDAGGLVGELRRRLADGDEDGFLAVFTPGARTMGQVWYRAWRQLPLLTVREEGGVRMSVSWRVAETAEPSTEQLSLRLAGGRIDGAQDAPGATPVWLRHPVTVARDDRTVAIVTGADADAAAADWLDLAIRARGRLDELGVDAAAIGWDRTIVVEVPADQHAFNLRTGLTGGPSDAAGALTHEWERQPRVVINPAAADDWPRQSRQGLVMHEVVHAAYAKQVHPEWLREGLADWIALPWWPDARAANDALLPDVPVDARLPMGQTMNGDQSPLGYLLAEAAVAGIVAENGVERLLAWVADWSAADVPSEAQIEQWMRAELSRRR